MQYVSMNLTKISEMLSVYYAYGRLSRMDAEFIGVLCKVWSLVKSGCFSCEYRS